MKGQVDLRCESLLGVPFIHSRKLGITPVANLGYVRSCALFSLTVTEPSAPTTRPPAFTKFQKCRKNISKGSVTGLAVAAEGSGLRVIHKRFII